MTMRRGASLINIMVFVMFAMMVTAQVFFYTTTSYESLTEEREIMSYRFMLDSIMRLASADLALNAGERSISHRDGITADYTSFYKNTQITINNVIKSWDISEYSSEYHATIHDLDYSFDATFDRTTWERSKYSSENIYQKLFVAMPSEDVSGGGNWCRYYLLRAYVDLPEKKFYGRKLMYQVLFRRKETPGLPHNPKIQSFQEIWF